MFLWDDRGRILQNDCKLVPDKGQRLHHISLLRRQCTPSISLFISASSLRSLYLLRRFVFYLAWRVVEVICFIQSRTDLVHKNVYSMTLPINKAPCTDIRHILKLPLLNSSVRMFVYMRKQNCLLFYYSISKSCCEKF